MSSVHKTITLTHEQDDWIKAQVDAGHYIDEGEYIRDLIRREQERRSEIESVRVAEKEGGRAGQWVKNANDTYDVGPMQHFGFIGPDFVPLKELIF